MNFEIRMCYSFYWFFQIFEETQLRPFLIRKNRFKFEDKFHTLKFSLLTKVEMREYLADCSKLILKNWNLL